MIATAQTTLPAVSVIIPTRNRAKLLREAIESVLAVHPVGFDTEVIVVDDGSTDETVAVLDLYPVVVVRTNALGAASARNAGIAAARGRYIAFLDDDDVWLPNNLAPQLTLLEANPSFGAAYAQALLTTEERVPYGEPIPTGPLASGWIFADLLEHWPQIGTLVVRANVVREVGVLDVSLCSEEEWDWLLRIARRYPIGRVAEPVMLFRQRGGPDDRLAWHRFPDTMRVLRRHTRTFVPWQTLRWQRAVWRHRGWYASLFLTYAGQYAPLEDRRGVVRCIYYALRASPLHTLHARETYKILRTGGCAGETSRRVLVANYSGYIAGDDAMFEALLDIIQAGFGPNVTVAALTALPQRTATQYPQIQTIGHLYEFLASPGTRHELLDALVHSDLLIIGGGDLMEGQIALFVLAMLATIVGTPVVFAGVGVLDPAHPRGKRILRWTGNLARYIATRDSESSRILKRLGVSRPTIETLPDLAVALRHQPAAPEAAGVRRLLVVNLRKPESQYKMNWGDSEYLVCASVCRALIDNCEYDVLCVPLTAEPDGDEQLLETFKELVDRPGRVRVLQDEPTPKNIARALEGADAAIGMRLHFLVLAASNGVPLVAISYARKVRAFMQNLELEHLCIDVDHLNATTLLHCVDYARAERADIVERLTIWRQHARIQLENLGPTLSEFSRPMSGRLGVRRFAGRMVAWLLLSTFGIYQGLRKLLILS